MFQNNEINSHLLYSLVDLLLFLEFSDENIIDSDAAVQAMEQLSARLMEMQEADKVAFVSECKKLSAQFNGEKADFIANIGEHLGLD